MKECTSIFEHALGFDVVSDSINNTVVSYSDTDDLFKKADESIESYPMTVEDIGKNLVFLNAISIGKTDGIRGTEGFKDFIGASWDKFKVFIKKAFAAVRALLEQIGAGLMYLKDKILKVISQALKKNTVNTMVLSEETLAKRISDLETGELFDFIHLPDDVNSYEIPVADYVFTRYSCINMFGKPQNLLSDAGSNISDVYFSLFGALLKSSEQYMAMCNDILLSSKTLTAEYTRSFYDKMKAVIDPIGFSVYSHSIFNNVGIALKTYKLDLMARTFTEEEFSSDIDGVEHLLRTTKNDGQHMLTLGTPPSTSISDIAELIKADRVATSSGVETERISKYTASEIFGANNIVGHMQYVIKVRFERLRKLMEEATSNSEKITTMFKTMSDRTSAAIKRVEAGMEMVDFTNPTTDIYRLTLSAYTRLISDFSMVATVSNYRYTSTLVALSKFCGTYSNQTQLAFSSITK